MGKKICVVGAGKWGRNHISTLHELGALGGIVEADPLVREQIGKQYSVPVLGDIEAALSQNFDGFVLATPAATHFPLARRIMEASFPVLVEKPLALTLEEGVALKELAEQQGVHLMVGHVLLFHPAIRKIRDLLNEGMLGRLQYIYSNRLNLGAVRAEENILWSFAPHDVSIFQYLIGRKPMEIVSRGGTYLQPGVADMTMTLLRYPDNIVAHIFVSWLHPFKEHRIVVIGSKGMLVFEDSSPDQNLLYYEKGIDWIAGEPIERNGSERIIAYDPSPPLREELQYFLDRLEDKEPVEISGPASGVEVLEILELASESLREVGGDRGATSQLPRNDSAREDSYHLHPSSFVDEDVAIGEGSRIWHFTHIQSGAKIGRNCTLGQNVSIGPRVCIGDNVKIQNNVSVYEGVVLEDDVFCGPSMVFTNVLDPRCRYEQKGSEHYHNTLVREGASIGANATIICGHTIGRHAFIGAGAVITSDVPDYALMLGVPARRRGWVCECGERLPEAGSDTVCPRCARAYRAGNETLVPLDFKGPARKRGTKSGD
ncbi:MAG: Gfo/Idh/MocA family oxidoreductase [Akkermansiaceae bacterium]|nr:Gfo/Idh/MocA family oxidoreductase [Akkermansiaceae bacterium]